MSTLPNPTVQGQQIIDAWTSTPGLSVMIDAYAGTGKTTFLQQLAPNITESRVLLLAFNKKNAEDLKSKMPMRFDCSTMNSIGHRAIQRSIAKRLKVDENKSSKFIKAISQKMGIQRLEGDDYMNAVTLTRLAKSYGLMPSVFPQYKTIVPDDESGWESLADMQMIELSTELVYLVRQTLIEGNKAILSEGLIDYDDQVYFSTLGVGSYEKYEVVGVDEAQDLSLINHMQVRKSLFPHSRLIIVGDPKQAIYAFRGASSKSMHQMLELRDNFQRFPLSLTFRCSKLVVERNVEHAPGFEAAPNCLHGDFYKMPYEWTFDNIDKVKASPKVAILCRNNAPLLGMAFKLIRSGRGVTMLGRDIGKSLGRLLHTICGSKKDQPIEDVLRKTNEWRDKEISLAIANGKEERLAMIEDRAESIIAVAEGCGGTTLEDVEQALISLFEDQSGLITLGTGHRAKGMEWETVVHLDPWRIPSKHAKTAEENGDPTPREQEMNLKYVIETRSKNVLIEANLKGFEP